MGPILFCHGFEGRPGGAKPLYLGAQLEREICAPDLSADGFRFEAQVAIALRALDARPAIEVVVGSSLGGFVAAVAAARRPKRALKLVLLAPAVNIHAIWAARLGPGGLAGWRDHGVLRLPHAGLDRTVSVPWAAYLEAQAASGVSLSHPSEIIHGLEDDVVPVADSLALAARSPGLRRLSLTPDGHRLHASLDVMVEAVERLEGSADPARRRELDRGTEGTYPGM